MNYRETRIIESHSNSNFQLKLFKNRITEKKCFIVLCWSRFCIDRDMSPFHDLCGITKCFPEIVTKFSKNAVTLDNRNGFHNFPIGRLTWYDVFFRNILIVYFIIFDLDTPCDVISSVTEFDLPEIVLKEIPYLKMERNKEKIPCFHTMQFNDI